MSKKETQEKKIRKYKCLEERDKDRILGEAAKKIREECELISEEEFYKLTDMLEIQDWEKEKRNYVLNFIKGKRK